MAVCNAKFAKVVSPVASLSTKGRALSPLFKGFTIFHFLFYLKVSYSAG